MTLIARLEAATEGSRDLDCKIAGLTGWTHRHDPKTNLQYVSVSPPPYTYSIDAALTLVPEWCNFWKLAFDDELYFAEFKRFDNDGGWIVVGRGQHETPPLALCIAALRARAAGEGKE